MTFLLCVITIVIFFGIDELQQIKNALYGCRDELNRIATNLRNK